MHAIIDADIVCFSCAIYNEPYGWEHCKNDIDSLMRRILETTGSDSYTAFLTGSNNFRYQINPEYKANRKDKTKPIYLEEARAYLVTEWGAKLSDESEADDEIAILARKLYTV